MYVVYAWRPPMCTDCKVFGHEVGNCKIHNGSDNVEIHVNLRLRRRSPLANNQDDEADDDDPKEEFSGGFHWRHFRIIGPSFSCYPKSHFYSPPPHQQHSPELNFYIDNSPSAEDATTRILIVVLFIVGTIVAGFACH
ncbi:hypothetical protein Tco_1526150, partial [Tanacetum coccineum]